MNEEIIREMSEILEIIYSEGKTILENYKNENNSTFVSKGEIVLEELFVKDSSFKIFQMESFWKLFRETKKNIENPIVQPWIRVIIEQASDIIWYLGKEENKRKIIACKYWLCTLGFLGGEYANMKYDKFLELLDNPDEKTNFSQLKEKGYPIKKIHKIWHNLFPAINEENMPQEIINYFLTIKGNSIDKSKIEMFFRDMSLYHHPNLIMDQLERESEDKSHVFRCFALVSLSGLAIIKSYKEKNISETEEEFFQSLNNKMIEVYKKINEIRGFSKK